MSTEKTESVAHNTEELFVVVRNDEEQHSVWWTDRPIPQGWEQVGFSGTRDACLAHIAEIWTDIRPASLRRHLESQR